MYLVLAYNFAPARLSALRMVCMINSIALKAVAREDLSQTVGFMAGLPSQAACPDTFAGEASKAASEMLVLCGFNNAALNKFLAAVRRSSLKNIPLKAMLTPDNAGWTGLQLMEELTKEHEFMSQNQGKKLHEGK